MPGLAATLAGRLLARLASPLTRDKGVPLRISINGVLCERVSLDGEWLTIDGQPVYMEI